MQTAKTATDVTTAATAAPVAAAPAPVVVAKPVAKPVAKAAAKPAAKPVAKKPAPAAKKPVAKPAVKAVAKPAVKAPAKAVAKAATKPAAAKSPKEKKIKMVRDSISIPKAEYTVLDDMKLRAAKLTLPVKKTELIRAGIKALAALPDAAFLAAVRAVPNLKTGRPAKAT